MKKGRKGDYFIKFWGNLNIIGNNKMENRQRKLKMKNHEQQTIQERRISRFRTNLLYVFYARTGKQRPIVSNA